MLLGGKYNQSIDLLECLREPLCGLNEGIVFGSEHIVAETMFPTSSLPMSPSNLCISRAATA
jgi:hypothetical protein